MSQWLTVENLQQLSEQYRALGPLIGFFITFLEAYLPFLPLVVFIAVNVTAYGLVLGFFMSWLGTLVGSFTLFLLFRRFGQKKWMRKWVEKKQVKNLIRWVEMAGIAPLLVLLCFPFTPAIIINIVAGLSNIKRLYYFITLFISKFAMVFLLTFIVQDLTELLTSPKKMVIVASILIALWAIGKVFEKILNKRVERDLRALKNKHSKE